MAIMRALPDATTASSVEAAQKMVRSWPAYAELSEQEQCESEWLIAARCGKRNLPEVTG